MVDEVCAYMPGSFVFIVFSIGFPLNFSEIIISLFYLIRFMFSFSLGFI